MTSRAAALVLVSAVVIVAGIGLALWPYQRSFQGMNADGQLQPLHARCEPPVIGAWFFADDGWFNYSAPNSGDLLSGDAFVRRACGSQSRLRLGAAWVAIGLGGTTYRSSRNPRPGDPEVGER